MNNQFNPFEPLSNKLKKIEEKLSEQNKLLTEIHERSSPPPSNSVRYICKAEAASTAGVSLSTIDNWRRAKKISSYKFDSAVRFMYDEFIEFLASQKKAS